MTRLVPVSRAFVCFVLVLAAAGCGPKPFLLGDFNHPGVGAFVCQAPSATGWGTCAPQTSTNELDWQLSGTVRAPVQPPLFVQCRNGVRRLLVKDPSASNTQIVFECAPPPPIVIETAGPAPAAPARP